MSSRLRISSEDATLLLALQRGPIVGINKVLASALPNTKPHDKRVQRHLIALQALINHGFVTSERCGNDLRVSLTCRGRQAQRASSRTPSSTGRLWKVAAGLTAMVAAGCMTTAQGPAPRVALMGYPTPVGVQQIRASDGGSRFVICDPCAAPTPKTLVTADALAAGQHGSSPRDAPQPRERLLREPSQVQMNPTMAHVAGATEEATRRAPEMLRLSVHFAFGEALLARPDRQALAGIAPRAETVKLMGGADAKGSALANDALAKARTAVVQSELERLGVPADRIQASHCAACYVASNDTAEGRRKNRRVDVEVTAKMAAATRTTEH